MKKRAFDFLFGLLLLVLALPLIAVAALLIKIDSGGPVFFRQMRMGRGRKPFQLLKLRTMGEAEGGLPYTLGYDERITRVGSWLRRLKLDELPQLWHVVSGEMSLVGPRPVIPELTVEFEAEYRELLKVRPGLTDPATLKYFREAEILALVPEPLPYFKRVVTPDKLQISAEYLQRATLWSDLLVVGKTAAALAASMPEERGRDFAVPEARSGLI